MPVSGQVCFDGLWKVSVIRISESFFCWICAVLLQKWCSHPLFSGKFLHCFTYIFPSCTFLYIFLVTSTNWNSLMLMMNFYPRYVWKKKNEYDKMKYWFPVIHFLCYDSSTGEGFLIDFIYSQIAHCMRCESYNSMILYTYSFGPLDGMTWFIVFVLFRRYELWWAVPADWTRRQCSLWGGIPSGVCDSPCLLPSVGFPCCGLQLWCFPDHQPLHSNHWVCCWDLQLIFFLINIHGYVKCYMSNLSIYVIFP